MICDRKLFYQSVARILSFRSARRPDLQLPLLLIRTLILRKDIYHIRQLISAKCPEPSSGTMVHDFNSMLCKYFISWRESEYNQLFSWFLFLPHLTCTLFCSIHLPCFLQQRGKWHSESMSFASVGSASLYQSALITQIFMQLSIFLLKIFHSTCFFSKISQRQF